ncbi:flagellar basal body rod protein FlgB [Pseudomonas sp. Marseille-QA0892]
MTISFDSALGIHEKALHFRAQRAEVLGNNLANADTPHYKARDLDFKAVLAQEADKASGRSGHFAASTTNARHIAMDGAEMNIADPALRFRIPTNPALDQNTVDAQVEQANYAENALQFQTSFTLLNSKFKGLITAIRGE